MQISCFPNSYGRFGPQAAIELLPQAGVKWLELPIKNAGMPSFFKETPLLTDGSAAEEVTTVQRMIEESELSLSSCNITSGNPLEEVVLERTLKKIAIAGTLGVPLVVAGGGEATSEEERATLIDHMRTIGDTAAEYNLVYCCETHPGTCVNAEKMLEFLERVNHPHVMINFDTGNLFHYNESPHLLKEMDAVMPFVKHVHLKDTNGGFKEWHFPALGAGGAVDFVAVRKVLEAHDFQGPCSLETEGIEGEPELSLDATHERIVASIEHLRSCGYSIE